MSKASSASAHSDSKVPQIDEVPSRKETKDPAETEEKKEEEEPQETPEEKAAREEREKKEAEERQMAEEEEKKRQQKLAEEEAELRRTTAAAGFPECEVQRTSGSDIRKILKGLGLGQAGSEDSELAPRPYTTPAQNLPPFKTYQIAITILLERVSTRGLCGSQLGQRASVEKILEVLSAVAVELHLKKNRNFKAADVHALAKRLGVNRHWMMTWDLIEQEMAQDQMPLLSRLMDDSKQDLLQFTHMSFQEYLCAHYIAEHSRCLDKFTLPSVNEMVETAWYAKFLDFMDEGWPDCRAEFFKRLYGKGTVAANGTLSVPTFNFETAKELRAKWQAWVPVCTSLQLGRGSPVVLLDAACKLERLSLSGQQFCEPDTMDLVRSALERNVNLEAFTLDFSQTAVEQSQLSKIIEKLPKSLKEFILNLEYCAWVGDALLKKLPEGLTSLTLNLRFTKVSEEAMKKHAKGLPKGLTSLTVKVEGTKLEDAGIIDLLEALPETLTSFSLELPSLNVGDPVMKKLGEALPAECKTLNLNVSMTQVTNKALQQLKKTLTSHGCKLTGPAATMKHVQGSPRPPAEESHGA